MVGEDCFYCFLKIVPVFLIVLCFSGCSQEGTEEYVDLQDSGDWNSDVGIDHEYAVDAQTPILNDYQVVDYSSWKIDCSERISEVSIENTGLTVEIEVFGWFDGYCLFNEKVIEDKYGLGMEGLWMTCEFPETGPTGEITDYCEGDLVDFYIQHLGVSEYEK
jgi:hypothetical protein